MMYFSCMVYFYYSIQQTIIPKRKKGSKALKLLCERPKIIESAKFGVRVSNINITSTSYCRSLKVSRQPTNLYLKTSTDICQVLILTSRSSVDPTSLYRTFYLIFFHTDRYQ